MKEFKDKKVIQALLAKIKNKTPSLPSSIRIMEVCGTHTMTVHRYGLKTMIEESGVEMVSGPGEF